MTVETILSRYRSQIMLAVLAAISLGFYLYLSSRNEGPGFPLDDAWIHQTYARNLIQHGEWSFVPGQPSAGSTAPLWSAVLAIGYWFKINPKTWAFFLGWAQLWIIGMISVYGLRLFVPDRQRFAFIGGVLIVLEFHIVWAAGSGMETLLYAILVIGFLIWLTRPVLHWFAMGLWIGLSVWVRPDGVTLLGPALMVLTLAEGSWEGKVTNLIKLFGGFFIFFGPYLLFNRALAGTWWPNTFFAKQAEYAILLDQSIMQRFAKQLTLPLIGIGVILLPGFVWWLYSSFRKRRWPIMAGAMWLIGYLFLYAWRLPVTYQHGRYIMPAMPVYFIWGLAGCLELVDLKSTVAFRRVLFRVWLLSGVIVLIAFWLRGASAYALDVAVIQTEMVATANWVEEHTPPNALIAAHDIGALGYYGNRQLIDLAGLISPQVIPFIRDEEQIAQYLDQKKVDYLVTFPGWYPMLVNRAELIHSTNSAISPSLGGENMDVYQWLGP